MLIGLEIIIGLVIFDQLIGIHMKDESQDDIQESINEELKIIK